MKIGYADPPYPGMAHRYQCEEIDYAMVITKLINEYDGWVLCMGANNLPDILPMIPVKYRIAAWVKPYAGGKPGVNPVWSWEPVIFAGGRKGRANTILCMDHLVENQRGTSRTETGIKFFGAKPRRFNLWVLNLIGFEPGDIVEDLFPGTGGMGWAVREREKITLPFNL